MARGGGVQDVFLVFYRNSFLHSLLPLDETSRYIRDLLLAAALGLETAYFPLCQRYGKPAISTGLMAGMTVVMFAGSTGSFVTDVMVMLLSAVFAAVSVCGAYSRRGSYEA